MYEYEMLCSTHRHTSRWRLASFASSDVTSPVLHLIGCWQQPRPEIRHFPWNILSRQIFFQQKQWRTSNLGFHHLWIKNRINKRDRKKNFDSKFKLSFASDLVRPRDSVRSSCVGSNFTHIRKSYYSYYWNGAFLT